MSSARRSGIRFLLTALLIGGAAGCQPGIPSQTVETEISILNSKADYLNVRLGKMEKSVEALTRTVEELDKNSRAGRADLSVAVEDVRTEVKTVGGNLGVLRHDLDELTRTNQKTREDFDARLTEMDQKLVATAAVAPVKVDPAGESARYKQNLALLQKKKSYDAAIEGFRDFLRDYPQSNLAANAQYWIGEAYYAKSDFARAISEYQVVLDKHPQGEKACDALLKQGFAFQELNEPEKSKLFLREVQERCPKSPAAAKAAERLAKP